MPFVNTHSDLLAVAVAVVALLAYRRLMCAPPVGGSVDLPLVAGQEADFEDSVFLEISSPHHRLGDIDSVSHSAGRPRSLVGICSRLGSPAVHFVGCRQRLCR